MTRLLSIPAAAIGFLAALVPRGHAGRDICRDLWGYDEADL